MCNESRVGVKGPQPATGIGTAPGHETRRGRYEYSVPLISGPSPVGVGIARGQGAGALLTITRSNYITVMRFRNALPACAAISLLRR